MKSNTLWPALAGAMLFAGCFADKPVTGQNADAPATPAEANKTEANKTEATKDVPQNQPVSVTLQMAQGALGRVMAFAITARNTTNENQTLRFLSGQSFDLTATPEGAKDPVWRWSDGKVFTRALRGETLAPKEAKTWTATWDQTNNLDNLVPRGRYVIEAMLVANGGLKTNPVTVELRDNGSVAEVKEAKAGVVVALSADKATYARGETAQLTLTARNAGTEPVNLTFNSGQRYDFLARPVIMARTERQREPVWMWSRERMFTMALANQSLAPDATLTYSEKWDLKDNAGKPLPPGRYAIEGVLTANGGVRSAPVTIEIKE